MASLPIPQSLFHQMEDSSHSSMNKTLSSKEATPSSSKESSWTKYFEDLSASEKREASGGSPSIGEVSSMDSDAASHAAWKPPPPDKASQSCKDLRYKKRKAKGVSDDDSLEDTASSPVNSPKVNDSNNKEKN